MIRQLCSKHSWSMMFRFVNQWQLLRCVVEDPDCFAVLRALHQEEASRIERCHPHDKMHIAETDRDVPDGLRLSR